MKNKVIKVLFSEKIMFLLLLGCILIILVPYSMAIDINGTENLNNFTTLNNEILNCNDSINLTGDFEQAKEDEYIEISKSIIINGQGHYLKSNYSSISLNINEMNISFENIKFKGNNFKLNNFTQSNISFINCSFSFSNEFPSNLSIKELNFNHKSGTISKTVEKLAKSIVGISTGANAAKKLANWVGKNIKAETKEGFYQSPYQTLKRKKGNCCSQTDLFLQMCDAVGVTKFCKLYFVHVGTMQFGNRHFFAIVDNRIVDVGSKPNDSWGQAKIGKNNIYSITQYPYLPLKRNY